MFSLFYGYSVSELRRWREYREQLYFEHRVAVQCKGGFEARGKVGS